jgi:hypothetical protein
VDDVDDIDIGTNVSVSPPLLLLVLPSFTVGGSDDQLSCASDEDCDEPATPIVLFGCLFFFASKAFGSVRHRGHGVKKFCQHRSFAPKFFPPVLSYCIKTARTTIPLAALFLRSRVAGEGH